MTPLFDKLNLGSHRDVLVHDAPESFEAELSALTGVTIRRDPEVSPAISFAILFVRTLPEVEQACSAVLSKVSGDAVIWFAYPKGSSKRYQCEFNRDNGWSSAVAAGFETVRQVAIDEDWSALRFRKSEFVKKKSIPASD